MSPSRWLWSTCLFIAGMADVAYAWLPGTGSPTAVDGFTVNASNRRDILAFYNCVYRASENYAANMAWAGSVSPRNPGTTSDAFKNDVRRRINFYRALGGLPADITFNATKSSKSQEAALMMSANNSLSHTPPTSWTCYTANGAEAAGKSNLSLGDYGPPSIDGYMTDYGVGNESVGHRRWLLYSLAREMGTGDVPRSGPNYPESNVTWVVGDFKASATPKFVPWPNEGYFPVSLLTDRWSLSYPNAGFGSATVTMTQNGTNVPVSIISRTAANIGDNTLVWTPTGVPATLSADRPYVITVSGITGTGVPTSKTYTVTLFDPNVLGESLTITGTSTPPVSGQLYTFNSITQADSYQLEVTNSSAALWTEGAEDSPAPMVTENIAAGYNLRQTGLKRTGLKAFQLTYPDGIFTDQSFIITRNIVPSATSQLQYYDRARYSTTTTTLETQVSVNGGDTWTTVATRNGVGNTSSLFDANWISRSVSLASYAGQVISLRFIMKDTGGSVFQGVTADYGFFIDDVTTSNSTYLTNSIVTTLAGSATSFTLNATTAGSSLTVGTSYVMRMRPNVGTRWFGYGEMKTVTATTSVSVAVAPTSVLENAAPTLVYTFTRTGSTTSALTANFSVGGTATLATDYTQSGAASFTASSGTVTFAAGSATKTVTLDPIADTNLESDETVVLTVLTGSGYAPGAPTAATGTITNDDANVSIANSPASTSEDSAVNLSYTFTRTGATTGSLAVSFTVGGTATFTTDYTQSGATIFTVSTGSITFAAGATTATVTLDPIADTTLESNETVILTVTTGTGYNSISPTAATGTITNDDANVSIAISPASTTEDSAVNLSYTFTRTGATTGSLAVSFTVGGTATFTTDYTQSGATSFTASAGSITFAAGATTATVTLDPIADTILESNETTILTVTSGTGYTAISPTFAAGTIINVLTTFASWAAALETANGLPVGTISANPNGDHDHDGRPNLIEFAFGASPVIANDSAPRMPALQPSTTHLVLRYQVDTSLGNLTITSQASTTLGIWMSPGDPDAPVGFDDTYTTLGTIQTHEAKIPLSSGNRMFMRVRVEVP